MRTHGTNGSVGGAAKEVAEHANTIARLELQLALLEIKEKVAALGMGAALALAAAVFGLFGLGFAGGTVAAALAAVMPTWLALLIVTAAFFALSGSLGIVAIGRLRRGSPPVPREAIEEAKLTTEAVKSDGSRRNE